MAKLTRGEATLACGRVATKGGRGNTSMPSAVATRATPRAARPKPSRPSRFPASSCPSLGPPLLPILREWCLGCSGMLLRGAQRCCCGTRGALLIAKGAASLSWPLSQSPLFRP